MFLAYLISRYLGTWFGVAEAVVCGIFALYFLVSAHRQRERGNLEQPDVALVWESTDDQTRALKFTGDLDKTIAIHNRSERYVYNVQIAPLLLAQEIVFESIKEIGPNDKKFALGRWEGMSTLLHSYIYFFGDDGNERWGEQIGWRKRKPHNRGMAEWAWDIPMALSYESPVGTPWKGYFEFHYDPSEESSFTKRLRTSTAHSNPKAL